MTELEQFKVDAQGCDVCCVVCYNSDTQHMIQMAKKIAAFVVVIATKDIPKVEETPYVLLHCSVDVSSVLDVVDPTFILLNINHIGCDKYIHTYKERVLVTL